MKYNLTPSEILKILSEHEIKDDLEKKLKSVVVDISSLTFELSTPKPQKLPRKQQWKRNFKK